jgi:hypothetical protein
MNDSLISLHFLSAILFRNTSKQNVYEVRTLNMIKLVLLDFNCIILNI